MSGPGDVCKIAQLRKYSFMSLRVQNMQQQTHIRLYHITCLGHASIRVFESSEVVVSNLDQRNAPVLLRRGIGVVGVFIGGCLAEGPGLT